MDASTVVIIGFFVLFGILEYQERERRHRNAIAWMRIGRAPTPDWEGPPLWKILTVMAVTLTLSGFIGFLLLLGMKGGTAGPVPLLAVAVTLLPVLFLLVLIIIRDSREFIEHRRFMNGDGEDLP